MPKLITRVFALFAGLASSVLLPGCVVWDIRDNLVKSNQQIGEVKAAIDKANAALDQANQDLANANQRLDNVEQGLAKLDRTNALIDKVDNGLGKIDTTNDSLSKLDKQLALLASIDTSLGHLDQHLAAVRKTIGSINSMIPFMDLGGGPEEPTPTAGAAPGAGQAAPGETPPQGEATANASPRRDLIEGAWISRRDSPAVGYVSWSLVLLPNGRFYEVGGETGDADNVGTWTHDGDTLRLSIELRPATTENAGEPQPEKPAPEEYKVLLNTYRVLVLESDGNAYILSRP